MLKPREPATWCGVGLSLRTSAREFAKVCGKGSVTLCLLQLHPPLLLLTFNEIGDNKFVFPGVMVYISMLHFHFILKSFQKYIYIFFLCEGKRGVWDAAPVFKSY